MLIAKNFQKSWAAMCNEHQSLIKNNTKVTDLLAHHKPMSCKWVHKIKITFAREITKYKAQLVAQGFTQT
jgi:hypothetical protein